MTISWSHIFSGLEPIQVKLLKRLFGQSFFSGFASAYFFVAAYSAMLGALGIEEIPIAYLISGFGGVLLIKGFQRLQKDYGASNSHFLLTGIFTAWMWGLFYLNQHELSGLIQWWVGILSFILVIPFSAVFAMNIGTSCFQVLGVTKGKKWMAKLGIAETMAAMLAFLSAPILVETLGHPSWLFFIGGAAIIPLIRLSVIGYQKKEGSQSTYSLQNKVELKLLWRSPFFKKVIVATSISVAMIYWVDYTYIISVRNLARINQMTTSEVVSVFFAIVKVGELLGSLFSADLIRQLGTQRSLKVFALILLSVAFLIILLFVGFETPIATLVVFIISLKWFERVVRRTIELPANRIVLQVAKPEEKLGLQTALEGTVSQLATIGAALLAWLISSQYKNVDSIEFLVLLVGFIGLVSIYWVTRVFKVSKMYRDRLSNYLKDISADNKSEVKESKIIEQQKEEDVIDSDEAVRRLYNEKFIHQFSALEDLPDKLSDISKIIEMTDAASLLLKSEILRRYQSVSDETEIPESMQTKYNVMLMNIGESLVWLDLCMADLRLETEEEFYLYVSLSQSKDLFIKQLFTLLSWRYSSEEMKVIEGFMKGDAAGADDSQFAMELLDTVLPNLLKPYLLPVFESTSLEMKIKRWKQFFPAYRYSNDERLKDVVMRDFGLLTLSSKFWALRVLALRGKNLDFVHPFDKSSIVALRAAAAPRVSTYGSFVERFEKQLDYRNMEEVFIQSELFCQWLNDNESFSNSQKYANSLECYISDHYNKLKSIL